MIFEDFWVLENTHKISTHIHSFKEYLEADIKSDEEFYAGVFSIFMARSTLIIDEKRRK